ncbi:MAG: ornithine carbamoyltransferase [Candidatus Saccharibacteria bacterium]|nr:ornithine carbamoyltransferase [Candidatus Saccharibacteria bacterium]
MLNLKGQSFLALKDFTPRQIRLILDTAHQFKKNKLAGISNQLHPGKTIALLFEKTSTRTRCAFVVGARDLGMHAEFLGKDDIQLGKKESVRDTAMVLGRMFDGIEFRGFSHQTVEDLAKYSGIPVWNGLTDQFHPTQGLADLMTIEEELGFLRGARLAYVGDGRNNVSNTLMFASALMGLKFSIGAPRELFPDSKLVEEANQLIEKYQTGATITITEDPLQAVSEADAIYTDVWVSMGEEDKFAERISLLKSYQVNRELLAATHNQDVKFLHCLPAFHDRDTVFGKQIYQQHGLEAMEVTDEVFHSKNSVVFEQAENRVYTIEAVMALTL